MHVSTPTRTPAALPTTVQAVVVAVVPQFRQAKVRDRDGCLYAITRHTKGVAVEGLQEGQKLRCTVTRGPTRVVEAVLL